MIGANDVCQDAELSAVEHRQAVGKRVAKKKARQENRASLFRMAAIGPEAVGADGDEPAPTPWSPCQWRLSPSPPASSSGGGSRCTRRWKDQPFS